MNLHQVGVPYEMARNSTLVCYDDKPPENRRQSCYRFCGGRKELELGPISNIIAFDFLINDPVSVQEEGPGFVNVQIF